MAIWCATASLNFLPIHPTPRRQATYTDRNTTRNLSAIATPKETVSTPIDGRDHGEQNPEPHAHQQDEDEEQEAVDAARLPRIGHFSFIHVRRRMRHHGKEREAADEHEGDGEIRRQGRDGHDARALSGTRDATCEKPL